MSIDNIQDMNIALDDFDRDHGNDLPEFVRGKFRKAKISPSPRDKAVDITEILYAAGSDAIGEDGMTLCRNLAIFAGENSWIQDQKNGHARSNMIVKAMRRDLGEGTEADWPAKDADPSPETRYVEPQAAEAPGSTE